MNNINRVLVKSQAKSLIRDRVFVLFIVSAVVLFLVNGLSVSTNIADGYDFIKNADSYRYGDDNSLDDYNDYYDYFEQFYGDDSIQGEDNPLESFGKDVPQNYTPSTSGIAGGFIDTLSDGLTSVSVLIGAILSPLCVTLCGFYVMFIRKNPEEELKLGAELKNIFVKSFDSSFLRKLLVYMLRNLFVILWSILLVIPGIVYSYSSYFAFQLMNDYPNLKPTEALKLSKKMVKGNRAELFWLDVSFIPWYLLCAITCGIAAIYVIPYYCTTQALYYENFRMRALAEGRVSEDDFLSQEERMRKYASQNAQGDCYNPNTQTQYNPNYSAGQNYYTQQGNTQQDYYYKPNQAEPEEDNAENTSYSYAEPQGDGVSGEYVHQESVFEDNVDNYSPYEQEENNENQ